MGDLEWMLGVIMISGFLFAAIARFNLHRYFQHRKTLTITDNHQAYMRFENISPETILDAGLHQLVKYFISGMVIFISGSAILVDNGALEALMIVFVE